MFLTFLILIIATILGWQLCHFFLGEKLKKDEYLLLSIIVGFILMSYFILITALIFKELKIAVWSFLIFGFLFLIPFIPKALKIAFYYLYNPKLIAYNLKNISWLEIIFLFIVILFFLDLGLKTLTLKEGAFQTTAASYGDIPFHMNQVSYFINSPRFSLQNPIYYGSALTYPFLINLLSASFYILNQNYLFSFHLPSFILAISSIILFYLLISRYINKVLARICAFLIFFLASGLGFFKLFFEDNSFWLKKNISDIINFILHPPAYRGLFYNAQYPDQNIIWTNFFTMFLLHQRTMFFGFALSVGVLFCLYLAYLHKEKKIFYFSGILIGLSSLIHTHTFVALSIILVGFFLASALKRRKILIKGFFRTALTSFAISLPSLLYLISGKINKNFITFRLGWMTEKNGLGSVQYNPQGNFHLLDWLSFIWQNFGFFFPILILAIIFILFYKKEWGGELDLILPLILSSVFLWTILNIIKFQPWDFDNNKIFAYFLIISSLIIGYFFNLLSFKGEKIVIFSLTFLIVSTGLVDALSRSSFASPQLYSIFDAKKQEIAKWINNNINFDQLILTGNSHLNLVASLSGRPVLEGYPGWLWTHGINYRQRENDISEIFKGGSQAKKLIKKYNIKYIMIGPQEKYNFKVNESFFEQNYKIILKISDTKIYKVSND